MICVFNPRLGIMIFYPAISTSKVMAKNQRFKESNPNMLYTIAVVLVLLWLLGLVSAYTMGGFIHILLVIAVVVILVRVITGRKPL